MWDDSRRYDNKSNRIRDSTWSWCIASVIRNYKKKSSHVVFLTHHMKKTLVDLYSFMRGKSYDDQDYLTQVRVIVDIIIDMCPLVDKWDKEYSQKFISE